MTEGARQTTYGYHTSEGWLETVQNAISETTTYDRDGAWRVIEEERPDTPPSSILQSWDGAGNLLSLTPPGKPAHAFTYTDRDERDHYEPPDLDAAPNQFLTDWDYDMDRRLDAVTQPVVGLLDYQYDTAGRLWKIVAGTTELRVFGYDGGSGQLTSIDTPFGSSGNLELSFGYDGHLPTTFDWLATGTSENFGAGVTLAYDNNFWVTDETVSDGTTNDVIHYEYDDDGLPVAVGPQGHFNGAACDGAYDDCLSVTWDPDTGRLDSTAIGVVTDSYGYSAFGELSSYTASVNGSPVFSFSITDRDDLGRTTEKSETVQGVTTVYGYEYDDLGRLWKVYEGPTAPPATLTHTYGYDLNGNRTSHTSGGTAIGTYDNIDTYGGWAYTVNDRGDVTGKSKRGSSWTYGYDEFGSLAAPTPSATEPTARTAASCVWTARR